MLKLLRRRKKARKLDEPEGDLFSRKSADPSNTQWSTQERSLRKEFPEDFRHDIGESKTGKARISMMWAQCRNFLMGNQYIRPVASTNGYTNWVRIPKPPGQVRETVNMLVGPYRTMVSRLAVDWPGMQVVPASISRDDVNKAKATNLLLAYYWQQERMSRKFAHGSRLLAQYGVYAFHTYWDAADEWAPTKVINPRDLFFERGVSSPDESVWIAIRDFVHRKELMRMFPEYADIIREMPSTTDEGAERFTDPRGGHQNPAKDRIETFEVYFRDGRHGLWTQDNWLMVTEMVTDDIPVSIVRHTTVEDELWPMGQLEPALGQQVNMNELWTNAINHVRDLSVGKYIVPEGAIPNVESLDRGKRFIHWNWEESGGNEIKQLELRPIPAHVFNMLDASDNFIQKQTSVDDVSMGRRGPGDPTAAVAIKTLQEADAGDLEMTKMEMEDAAINVGKSALRLFKKYGSKEQAVKIFDRTIGPAVYDLVQRTEICDDAEIHLHAATMFRSDALVRRREAFQLLQAGVIDITEFKQRTGDWTADVDSIEAMVSELHAEDILDVCRNFHRIAKVNFGVSDEAFIGLPDDVLATMLDIQIQPTDDPQAFVRVFGEYMKSREYYNLPTPTQRLIRKVFAAAATFGQPDPAYLAAQQQNVFPRQPQPGGGMPMAGGGGQGPLGPLSPPSQMPGQGPAGGPPRVTPMMQQMGIPLPAQEGLQ